MGEPFAPQNIKIPVHTFFAACHEVAFGPRTLAQIESYFNMDAATIVEFELLTALVIGNDATKLKILQGFDAVFVLAATKVVPFYTTPTEVRTRLGLPIL